MYLQAMKNNEKGAFLSFFIVNFFNVSLPLIGQNNVLVLKEHPYFKFEQIVIFKWSKEKGTVVSY